MKKINKKRKLLLELNAIVPDLGFVLPLFFFVKKNIHVLVREY